MSCRVRRFPCLNTPRLGSVLEDGNYRTVSVTGAPGLQLRTPGLDPLNTEMRAVSGHAVEQKRIHSQISRNALNAGVVQPETATCWEEMRKRMRSIPTGTAARHCFVFFLFQDARFGFWKTKISSILGRKNCSVWGEPFLSIFHCFAERLTLDLSAQVLYLFPNAFYNHYHNPTGRCLPKSTIE